MKKETIGGAHGVLHCTALTHYIQAGCRYGGSTAVEGQVTADIEPQPLSSINEIFAWLQHGDVAPRVVLDVARGES